MNRKLCTGIGLGLIMAACASMPKPNPTLDNARAAVRSAEADPNVPKYAPLDLDAAKKDLQLAEAAAMHHEDAAVTQPAYMAAQTARVAQLHAAAKADDVRVAAGQSERDQIQLAARAREANNAKLARDQEAAKAARLQTEIDELKAQPTDRGLVLTLGDVLFETGKAELNSGAARKLDQLAQFLTEHPDRRVEIDGFTDSVGTDAFNQGLSERRADSVRFALQSRGIAAARISSQGFGKGFPVASNTESSGRQLNRRVEVVIGGENNAAIATRVR
jgi:outer membrane protein OmpA-like peptidoglycan-associated protein